MTFQERQILAGLLGLAVVGFGSAYFLSRDNSPLGKMKSACKAKGGTLREMYSETGTMEHFCRLPDGTICEEALLMNDKCVNRAGV